MVKCHEYGSFSTTPSVSERVSDSVSNAYSNVCKKIKRVVDSVVSAIKQFFYVIGTPFRVMNDAKNEVFDKLAHLFGTDQRRSSDSVYN